MNINHIGYLVTDLDAARQSFCDLGFTPEGTVCHDESRHVYLLFMVNGGYRIELVCPDEQCTLFSSQMLKRAPTPYHICYECTKLEEAIEHLSGYDFMLIRPPAPAPAFGNRRVAFMYNDTTGQIELLEMRSN